MNTEIIYFKCGKILKTHGVKGELKVKPLTDFDRFTSGNKLYINHQYSYIEVTVDTVRDFGEDLLVTFKDLHDINLVEKYHGDEIFVHKDDREELDEGYYYNELIGKKVINQNKEDRGIVKTIINYPQADYLEINYNNKKHLVPFIDEFIIEVTDDYIMVNEIEGLF